MDKERLSPSVKFWLEKGEEPIVGKGRIELLTKIDKKGSLNKAAEAMEMSYRHAWGIISKLEERLGYKLVKSKKGGKGGGGTTLTEEGREIVEKYKWMKEGLNKTIKERTFWENMSNKLSARNNLKGEIKEVELGEVGAKIKIEVEPKTMTAFITKEAAEELDLEEGDEAEAVIKATEVMISKEEE